MVVQRKPAIKKVGGKVFALDYGRLMGGPIYSFLSQRFIRLLRGNTERNVGRTTADEAAGCHRSR